MIFQEVLRRVKFKVGTTDDISGRAINPIVSNRNIVDELNSQIRQYANITKGIQDIYSFSYDRNTVFVDAPPLALRSEAYFAIYVISNGVIFMMDMKGQQEAYNNFRVNPIQGIPSWVMPYNIGNNTKFNIFPANSNNSKTTTISSNILKDDTTIQVISTNGFIHNNGRFTLENEKIEYQYKDNTHFYGCVRGLENTQAVSHETSSIIKENNVIIYYSRLHDPIIINDDTYIPNELLQRNIEVVDEHMEGVIKAVAYNLLVKIDLERASTYKEDFNILYAQYKSDIKRGYYAGRMGTNFRDPYFQNESSVPGSSNLMF
jgi:hypothetical protein